jgi:predicted membrane-bound mannosyltransferase
LKIALQQTPFNDESVVGEFKLQFMVSRACNYNQVYHVKSFFQQDYSSLSSHFDDILNNSGS